PATPNQPATTTHSQQPPQATPPSTQPTLEEELDLPIETGDKDEEEITPTHPDFHKDKVTKLKHKLQELGKRHNNLLNTAKFNSKVAKNKIKELKGKVSNIANLAENL
ncbi:hypothetical protein ACHAO7_012195, partial [Fusarium culmorum]